MRVCVCVLVCARDCMLSRIWKSSSSSSTGSSRRVSNSSQGRL